MLRYFLSIIIFIFTCSAGAEQLDGTSLDLFTEDEAPEVQAPEPFEGQWKLIRWECSNGTLQHPEINDAENKQDRWTLLSLNHGIWTLAYVDQSKSCNESAEGVYISDEKTIRSVSRSIYNQCDKGPKINGSFLRAYQGYELSKAESGEDQLKIIFDPYASQNFCKDDGKLTQVYQRYQIM